MNSKKKSYAKSKKAFDNVMGFYRALSGIGSISAVNMAASAKGSVNPAKPTPLDFKADVDRVIKKIVPEKYRVKFAVVYILIEAPTALLQEMLADKIIGGARHSFEQRIGDAFIQRGIHPVQQRGYFHCIRKARKK